MFRSPCLLILIPSVSLHVNMQREEDTHLLFIRHLHQFSKVFSGVYITEAQTRSYSNLANTRVCSALHHLRKHISGPAQGRICPSTGWGNTCSLSPTLSWHNVEHTMDQPFAPTDSCNFSVPLPSTECPTGASADDKDPLYVHTPQNCHLGFVCALPWDSSAQINKVLSFVCGIGNVATVHKDQVAPVPKCLAEYNIGAEQSGETQGGDGQISPRKNGIWKPRSIDWNFFSIETYEI